VSAPDFVAIGHVTLDRFGGAVRPGGAALYAAVTAHRLGASAGILTSHGDDFPLELVPPQIEVVAVPSLDTTTFTHSRDAAGGRVLTCQSQAAPLVPEAIPEDWRDAPIVLLAPVLNELDPAIAAVFPDATIGAAAQGWLRGRKADASVVPTRWDSASLLLSRIRALFLSGEDARSAAADVDQWLQQVPIAVITAGRLGALLFVNGERYAVPPLRVREVDPTGAGDVFAAAFMVEYEREGNPWDAAASAACAAALSVEGEGFSAIPDSARLAPALEEYRKAQGHAP
jgi:sugar/nucleoside kinase (ribokinase family)